MDLEDACPEACAPGCEGDSGNCCIANGGLGCEDPVCEAAVCAIDSFCCNDVWDGFCASEAADPNLVGDACCCDAS